MVPRLRFGLVISFARVSFARLAPEGSRIRIVGCVAATVSSDPCVAHPFGIRCWPETV